MGLKMVTGLKRQIQLNILVVVFLLKFTVRLSTNTISLCDQERQQI